MRTEPDLRTNREGRAPKGRLLLALAVCGAANRLFGDGPATYGMVAIAQSETARLTAVQALVPDATACVAEMKFLDATGRALAVAAKVQLLPGIARHLELPGAIAYRWQPVAAVRSPIRAQLTPLDGVCALTITVELFDSVTGRAAIVMHPN